MLTLVVRSDDRHPLQDVFLQDHRGNQHILISCPTEIPKAYLENGDSLREESDTSTNGSAPEENRGLVVLHSFGSDGSETLL